MRAYLVACLAIVVVGTGAYFLLNAVQLPSGEAYAVDGARITTSWAWRYAGTIEPVTRAEQCDTRKPWQWFFVDFGRPAGEPAMCSVSQ